VGCVPLIAASSGYVHAAGDVTTDVWGTVALESRIYPTKPLYPQQETHDHSLTFEPTVFFENQAGNSFTLTPFLRLDASDSERTHVDIREAYFLTFGDIGSLEWEFRIGIDQVFWGTTESNNPVNIINQTDLVEHPGGNEKLGQPMLHGTLAGDWGLLDLFALPFHRPRTYPGNSGRLRTENPVLLEDHGIKYEDGSGKRHVDLAARYSHTVGPVDFGISYFNGTSREPLLIPKGCERPRECYLQQQYNQISQFGLDLQFTQDAFIGKAEIINRKGFDRQGPGKTSHNAFVIGGEYTLYGILDSDADLTLFGEYNRDGRGRRATTSFQDDIFLAARYTFNDVEDTDFTVAMLHDMDYETKSLNLEFTRRLNDNLSLKVEGLTFFDTDSRDAATWQVRDDDYVLVNLSFSY